MLHTVRDGVLGLLIGAAGGLLAGLLVAPKRRAESTATAERPASQPTWATSGSGLLPDEQITQRLRAELASQNKGAAHVDITTVDGVVYLRGRESDPIRADGIVAVAHDVPGVVDVIDEVRREA